MPADSKRCSRCGTDYRGDQRMVLHGFVSADNDGHEVEVLVCEACVTNEERRRLIEASGLSAGTQQKLLVDQARREEFG